MSSAQFLFECGSLFLLVIWSANGTERLSDPPILLKKYGRHLNGPIAPAAAVGKSIFLVKPSALTAARKWQNVRRALYGFATRFKPTAFAVTTQNHQDKMFIRTGRIMPFRTGSLNTSRFVDEDWIGKNRWNPLTKNHPFISVDKNSERPWELKKPIGRNPEYPHVSGYTVHTRLFHLNEEPPAPPSQSAFTHSDSPSLPPGFRPQPPGTEFPPAGMLVAEQYNKDVTDESCKNQGLYSTMKQTVKRLQAMLSAEENDYWPAILARNLRNEAEKRFNCRFIAIVSFSDATVVDGRFSAEYSCSKMINGINLQLYADDFCEPTNDDSHYVGAWNRQNQSNVDNSSIAWKESSIEEQIAHEKQSPKRLFLTKKQKMSDRFRAYSGQWNKANAKEWPRQQKKEMQKLQRQIRKNNDDSSAYPDITRLNGQFVSQRN